MIPIWRWVLLGLARRPLLLVLWLVLAAWVPLEESLRTLPSSQSAIDLALLWAFPVSLLGGSLGLEQLSRGSTFLARVPPATRWAGEAGALALAPLYLQLPIFLGALVAGATALDLGFALPDILSADLSLAGIALVFLALPLPTRARIALLLGAAWLLPALCAHQPRIVRALVAPLDVGMLLHVSGSSARVAALAAAVAFLLVAYLLRTTRTRAALR